MNLINAFTELDKLYESVETKNSEKTIEITEAADDNDEIIIDDEPVVDDEQAIEEPVEDEPIEEINKQIVLECSNCGALVIKKESEVNIDEKSGVANVEEECTYCGETAGFKAMGTFEAYDNAIIEENAEAETEEAKEVEPEETAVESDEIDEAIFNRKSKDKAVSPADYIAKADKIGKGFDKLQQDTLAKYGKSEEDSKA